MNLIVMHECVASGGALRRVGINKLCHDYWVWQRLLMRAPVSQLTGHMTLYTHLSLLTCRCSALSRPLPPAISPPWSPAPDVRSAWSPVITLLCLLTLCHQSLTAQHNTRVDTDQYPQCQCSRGLAPASHTGLPLVPGAPDLTPHWLVVRGRVWEAH